MIRLKNLLNEANPKADFLKAISGIKPAEVYRIHAKLPNGKVGITAWYTKAVIDDLENEIKNTGATIIKIEKSTKEADIKENNAQEKEYKIGDKVDIPFLNRREIGIIRRIKNDEALVLVKLEKIKGKAPVNKELWVKIKDMIKAHK